MYVRLFYEEETKQVTWNKMLKYNILTAISEPII
jgi:hypothetical protein